VDPDLIVIEGPSYGSKNAGSQHDRSGLWWLLIDVFTIRGWRVIEASPSTRMKYATGKGMVAKELVFAAAIKRLPVDVNNSDEADAAWLCAIGHDLLGEPLVEMPVLNRSALVALQPQLASGGPK
jgi:crossover junction endodeoxyribonuclease RuvC